MSWQISTTGSGTGVATLLAVVAGCLLVLLVLLDVFRTVLWSGQGAGPLTGTITALGRRVLSRMSGGARVRSAVGPIAIVTIVGLWAALLLVGFTLILQGQADSFHTAFDGQPVDWSERAYFVGYSLFTLGNGDLAPTTDVGRLLTVAIAATGLFLISLSVTYLLPVTSAAVASRSFASAAGALGDTAEDVVLGAWDGDRVHLTEELRQLALSLSLLAEQQLAYPVLHLFESSDQRTSAPLAIAQLDDVLTLLDGVDPRVAPPAAPRRQLRAAIRTYARTYGAGVRSEEDAPPVPATAPLAAAGIPLGDPAAYTRSALELDAHRAEVRGLVRATGIDPD